MSAQAESTPAETRIDRLSPDSLVATFSESHLLRWFLLAFLIHAIVIGGMSIGNIRDMLDPEGAKARNEAASAAAKAPPAAATQAPAPAAPAADATAATPAKPDAEKSPVEKATTEVAKPGDIPKAPDDLGLSIEDTNPQ
jgi:nucleoid-associated protein YgaU